MTDAITSALADLDAAISSASDELSTLVTQIGVLTDQVNSGNVSPDLVAEIEQRAKTIQNAVSTAQGALPTPPPTPEPTPEPAPTPSQPAEESASVVNPPSPSTSTPVEDPGPAKASGSPMG